MSDVAAGVEWHAPNAFRALAKVAKTNRPN
jgi:hypothetical protein